MEKHYAGFWVRFFAGLLDIAFLTPPLMILIYLSGAGDVQTVRVENSFESYSAFSASVKNNYTDIISYALSVVYIGYFLSSKKQATLGKSVLGIYVGNPDGSKLSFFKALARAAASIITSVSLGIGFLLVIFTKEKTALHDLICNTRVFHGKKHD